MKHFLKKNSTFIIIFLLAAIFFYSREEIIYGGGKDTWDYFGNGRFQIGEAGLDEFKFLFDNSIDNTANRTIVGYIEKYIESDPHVYIAGYHQQSWAISEASTGPFYAYLPGTGEQIKYQSIEEIPYYIKLNYRTGEAKYYLTLEDIPEEDQIWFNKTAGFWCESPFWRTCYQAP